MNYRYLIESATQQVLKIMDVAKKASELNNDFKKAVAMVRIDLKDYNFRDALMDMATIQRLFDRAKEMYKKNLEKSAGMSDLSVIRFWTRFFRTWLFTMQSFDTGDFDAIFEKIRGIADDIEVLDSSDVVPTDTEIKALRSRLDAQISLIPSKLYKMKSAIQRLQKTSEKETIDEQRRAQLQYAKLGDE